MLARVYLTSMILYDVGVSNVASRHDLNNNYINFLLELNMHNEAENVTQLKLNSLIEELYNAGIVKYGRYDVRSRYKGFNRDSSPHKVSVINKLIFKIDNNSSLFM